MTLEIPSADQCVIGDLLHKHAKTRGDKILALFENGEKWTFSDALANVRPYAAGLQKLGVKQHDYVLGWIPNGPQALLAWWATNYLGAVFVPINLAYRGDLLQHVVRTSGASLMIAAAGLVPRLNDVDVPNLKRVVCFGDPEGELKDIELLPEDCLTKAGDKPTLPQTPVKPWDQQVVIFTSGTTGPSKAVPNTNIQLHQVAHSTSALTDKDRALVATPLFHSSGVTLVYRALMLGGSFAMVDSFKTQTFWEMIKKYEITVTILLSAMIDFLMKQPESDDDRDNPLRIANTVPLTQLSLDFGKRFGVEVYSTFGMTELPSPLVTDMNPDKAGCWDKVRDGFEVRIVDENDCPVPIGEVGELIVRADMPWSLTPGYLGNPEATVKLWRNGWLHTGDGFRQDAEGNYFFVDRLKDAIRRRGENISSYEVETVFMSHPQIKEATAVATPGEGGEDELLVAFALKDPGERLDEVKFTEFLRSRMPHFMVPRYLRQMKALPKTPTHKVQKAEIRREGVTSDTWDRVAAGIEIKREKITIAPKAGG